MAESIGLESPRDAFAVAEHVLVAKVEERLVLLNTLDGHYLEANPTASAILEALDAGKSVSEAAALVAQRFRVDQDTAQHDAEALVAECLSQRIILQKRSL